MNRSIRVLGVFAVLAVTLLAAVFIRPERIVRMKDSTTVRHEEMVSDLKEARIVYVGENHDEKKHHNLQLRIIRDLHSSGVSLAIGMEMFITGSQDALDKWVAGTLTKEEFVAIYDANWGLPWHLYADILVFARENRIPLVALNVPREIAQKVGRVGFEALSADEKKKLPPGITCQVDNDYMKFIQRAYSNHDATGRTFEHFCEAQMLWNKAMGHNLLTYLRKNPGRMMVVVAGSGHAMKGGIPVQVRKEASEMPDRVVLPESMIPLDEMDENDADYVVVIRS